MLLQEFLINLLARTRPNKVGWRPLLLLWTCGDLICLVGAQNRLDYARNQIQNAELWVAMENGIWKSEKSPSGWVDGACVIIQKPNQAAEIRWSEELAVPQENMDNCIRDGQVVSNWSSLKDPHATLGKSRVQYLRETLTQ